MVDVWFAHTCFWYFESEDDLRAYARENYQPSWKDGIVMDTMIEFLRSWNLTKENFIDEAPSDALQFLLAENMPDFLIRIDYISDEMVHFISKFQRYFWIHLIGEENVFERPCYMYGGEHYEDPFPWIILWEMMCKIKNRYDFDVYKAIYLDNNKMLYYHDRLGKGTLHGLERFEEPEEDPSKDL